MHTQRKNKKHISQIYHINHINISSRNAFIRFQGCRNCTITHTNIDEFQMNISTNVTSDLQCITIGDFRKHHKDIKEIIFDPMPFSTSLESIFNRIENISERWLSVIRCARQKTYNCLHFK